MIHGQLQEQVKVTQVPKSSLCGLKLRESEHFSSLVLAMLVAICIPKDRVVGSAVHETQLRLGFIPFVSGLCVECLCSLECSAG